MAHISSSKRAGVRRAASSRLRARAALAAFSVAMGLTLGGCASVSTTPATLSRTSLDNARLFALQTPVTFKLDTGYERNLPEGSIWKEAGSVVQGSVYRPVGRILTVEGSQVHEAWIVVKDQKLVGFFLPGEATYSPLSTVVSLNLKEKSQ
ncbi:hypothetical protein [Pandoraea norimbergensis]|nr:hypothetical protein [Pandoraea norimbergensis]